MRTVYHPTTETYAGFKDALHNDLGIFHVQRGAGIGGFFKSLFKTLVPIGKSILKTGFEIAKPHMQRMGQDLAQKGVQAVSAKAEEFVEKQLTRKRPRDAFDNV